VPELVADLEDQAVACLMSVLPMERQQAVEVSKKLSHHLTSNWGGQLIYFPKNLLGRGYRSGICKFTRSLTVRIMQASPENTV
jgi:putative bacteriophage transcriptional regulator